MYGIIITSYFMYGIIITSYFMYGIIITSYFINIRYTKQIHWSQLKLTKS